MKESTCCGASPLWETEFCSRCGEWSEFEDIDTEPTDFFINKVNDCLVSFNIIKK